ncbi:hypothetical protein [Priestia megaterium]|uniref:hypothetical protein n=1 Tax=Priestia megaterium TaxID=1404 RepID=UPI002E222F3E|nr:hypothetical protein [Priestia megaterium]
MPYTLLINTMKNNYANINASIKNYSLVFQPPCNVNNLILEYPTYKGIGDYRLSLNGKSLSHGDLIDDLERYILSFPVNMRLNKAIELSDLLIDILNNGLNANVVPNFNIIIGGINYSGSQFVEIIYWLIGQEEINYPRSSRKMGVRLPITRYHEAIIAATYGFFTTDNVKQRANIRNGRPPLCLHGLVTIKESNQIDSHLLHNINSI